MSKPSSLTRSLQSQITFSFGLLSCSGKNFFSLLNYNNNNIIIIIGTVIVSLLINFESLFPIFCCHTVILIVVNEPVFSFCTESYGTQKEVQEGSTISTGNRDDPKNNDTKNVETVAGIVEAYVSKSSKTSFIHIVSVSPILFGAFLKLQTLN